MDELVAATEAMDADALGPLLHPEVVLRSPITTRVTFDGRERVLEVLRVVHGVVGPTTVVHREREGDTATLRLRTSVGGRAVEEAMLLRFAPDGAICEMTIAMRPMPGLLAFAAALVPRLAPSRPRAVVLRALLAPVAALVGAAEPLVLGLLGLRADARPR